MSRIFISALLLVTITAVADARFETEDPGVRQLVEQGRFWQSRSRWEEAAETWNKLLLSYPQHPEGLAGLAFYELQAGRVEAARDYLGQLRKRHPSHSAISQLARAVESTGGTELGPLEKARRLAAEQRYAEAIEQYDISFGGLPPEGELALEYYQTLGATEAGWDSARRGLERLLAEHPKASRYALALAQHLTYRESHRRDGIARLRALADRPEVAKASKSAWRQAILWLRLQPGDEPLYEAYLKEESDEAVQARLTELRRMRTPEQTRTINEGYAALEKEDLATAKRRFERVLKGRRNDPEALAGLGMVHFRSGEYHSARDRLAKALKAAPERPQPWVKAYEETQVWALAKDAEQARDRSDLARAEQLLRQALQMSPLNLELRVMLADVMAERGRYREAEADYRRVLEGHPDHAGALQGLVKAMSHQGRTAEALALIDRLSGKQKQSMGVLPDRLRATSYRAQAGSLLARGDHRGAQQALEQALVLDPDDAWIRLDLARLYQRQGGQERAQSLMQGLLLTAPTNPEVLYASALLSAEAGQSEESLRQLNKIPPARRTAAMRALDGRLRAGRVIAEGLSLARLGQSGRARVLLAEVERDSGTDLEVVGMLANAWVEIGEAARGLGLLRGAMGHRPKPTLRLQYAGLLLKTGQDSELVPLLRELEGDPRLTHQDRVDLGNLRVGHTVRRADAARNQGDLAGAYDLLAPYLRQDPTHPKVLMMLGHLYSQSGEPRQALSLYLEVLRREPSEVDARRSAFGAAMALGEMAQAEALVTQGLEQYPNSAQMNELAGRLARSRGREAKAIEYFERALLLLGGAEEAVPSQTEPSPIEADSLPLAMISSSMIKVSTLIPGGGDDPPGGKPHESNPALRDSSEADSPEQASFAPLYEHEVASVGATDPRKPLTLPNVNPFRKPPLQPSAMTIAQNPRANDISESHQVLHRRLLSELQAISAARSPQLATGLSIRARDGEEGLGELHDLEIPLQAELAPKGDYGRLSLRIVPVSLSAGDLDLSDANKAQRFGSNALALGSVGGGPISQDQQGVGVGVKWAYRDWTVDVGSSGIGFAVDNVIGGLRWQPSLGRFRLGFTASRRSVSDSLLSYAGTQDTLSGLSWGGVVSSGGRFDIAYDDGQYGLYGNAAYAGLDGERVASNTKLRLGGGLFWRAYEDQDQRVTAGVDITYFGYDKNLSHFTLGQGGYFSPQHYTSFGVPVTWSGRHDRVSFGLTGYLGLQTFDEDDSPFFPEDPGLQAQLETLAQSNASLRTFFPGQSKTGISYSFSANVLFQLQPKLAVGGSVSLDNARDFAEQAGMVYVRYYFEPQRTPLVFPPKPLTPLYAGEP